MFDDLISRLQKKGVLFESGLTEIEIHQIENTYDIIFPNELKEFYKYALPVSAGFYNWRDFNIDNVKYIQGVIKKFKENIIDCAMEIDWSNNWGKEPKNLEERMSQIKDMVNKAPTIIPIYIHRGMAAINIKNNPVFSILDIDVIYYGNNILEYFQLEFDLIKYTNICFNNSTYIPFWSDLVYM